MKSMTLFVTLFFTNLEFSFCLIPPSFQWKQIDYAWQGKTKQVALQNGAYIPENNMPIGVARWSDKVFVTVPRWRRGVPSSLNYVHINDSQSAPLNPYPSWGEAFVVDNACCLPTNSTVVSAFRVHVDKCDRLWVVDTGVADIAGIANQVTEPAIVIFDLKTDTLIRRFELDETAVKGPESFFTGIVVEIPNNKDCENAYAYIPDMGANSLVVYSLKENVARRIDHPYFCHEPSAGSYRVGNVSFYWSDGISAVALSAQHKDGFRDLYFSPVSSTKQFKISTKVLRKSKIDQEELFDGVEVVGDRGPKSQTSSCDIDYANNILFYTQISKNGFGCWNMEKEFKEENTPLIASDCCLMEFPNDLKVDNESNLWILSNKLSRFLYSNLEPNEVNFRVLSAPVSTLVKGTACDKRGHKWFGRNNNHSGSSRNKSGGSRKTSAKQSYL